VGKLVELFDARDLFEDLRWRPALFCGAGGG
jgi:hypothetical protein